MLPAAHDTQNKNPSLTVPMISNDRFLEINGTNSEPAHIYDPDYSLFNAYREVIKHMNLVYKISKANIALGVKPMPFSDLIKGLVHHLFGKK